MGEGLRTDEEMKETHSEQRSFRGENDGMGGRAQESSSSFGNLKQSKPKDESQDVKIARDQPYVYVQETYHVEWCLTPEEAEEFVKESKTKKGKHIEDFRRGTRRPDHVGQSVQVQDSRTHFGRCEGSTEENWQDLSADMDRDRKDKTVIEGERENK